ncbi:peroxisomal hydratase-dehydrogenase-epimerase [Exophiala aquamarina CBS 119918]|uniref:Peroxisomal hydratase-dehydrogenase-epimerase n=1 Tax=Exophiala aquamarina CBS 119918 TaxID=1182545 RepID=A0A072PV60_9EURO|nr:peroxisomal hydratase-dehydrogenase-epimerase [Exophiala aquamarina CBS 119918]KEF63223.1 peroxisomal hydratase-dehydrogenase-epimerase [Exophiala aquamarina CBS 119918]
MSQLRFDGQVAVVTGAGGGLGKSYATYLASRGAKIVVNDLGGSGRGEGSGNSLADQVVAQIVSSGGHAVADYNNVVEGDKIIQTALQSYGRIDILINNAGIIGGSSFKNMTDRDWDLMMAVHVTGAYKCTRAAWPHFRKQRYGRIVNTSSGAGLFGTTASSSYSAAKMALVAFTRTLALEGKKYNIHANVIAPIGESRLTAGVWNDETLQLLDPSSVMPLVVVLAGKNCSESGSIFEVGGGHMSKIKWERSKGAVFAGDSNFTARSLLQRWNEVVDFQNPEYPDDGFSLVDLMDRLKLASPNPQTPEIDFTGRVALVTGGGAGLGRSYCLAFARAGACVAVNDLSNAENVVKEIIANGGKAIAIPISVEDGETIVERTVKAFGRVDIIINNAGILRDKAFLNMDDKSWHDIMAIHLRATYKITRAAWPLFQKQKYGRVVNTTSSTGIYGRFGQANYAAAKAGVIGLAFALAQEGERYNIHVNTIAPAAYTNLSKSVMPPEFSKLLYPEYVVPLVLLLCSDKLPNPTGNVYEVGGGQVSQTRWIRSGGCGFPPGETFTPEQVLQKWGLVTAFDHRADHPSTPEDGFKKIKANIASNTSSSSVKSPSQNYVDAINAALAGPSKKSQFSYTARDIVLYNIGIGAKHTQLPFVYENDPTFQALPTFGSIISYFTDSIDLFKSLVPNFDPAKMLHGEQYLEILQIPTPTAATLVSETRVLEVVDKGHAALVKTGTTSVDQATNRKVFYNEGTTFLRGSGGFGGSRNGTDRGASTASNNVPPRNPDHVTEETVRVDQAVIYRLSGDYNPLHVDPDFAAKGGFPVPILHGLCTFGMAGRAVFERFGQFKSIKVRFTGTVLPGQTLRTEMWKENSKVIFQTSIKETGKLALAAAAVELVDTNVTSKL